MQVFNNSVNVQSEVDGYFSDTFAGFPQLDDVVLFLVSQAKGVGEWPSFCLMPTLRANKPVQVCVVFVPAVGADRFNFVVGHCCRGLS